LIVNRFRLLLLAGAVALLAVLSLLVVSANRSSGFLPEENLLVGIVKRSCEPNGTVFVDVGADGVSCAGYVGRKVERTGPPDVLVSVSFSRLNGGDARWANLDFGKRLAFSTCRLHLVTVGVNGASVVLQGIVAEQDLFGRREVVTRTKGQVMLAIEVLHRSETDYATDVGRLEAVLEEVFKSLESSGITAEERLNRDADNCLPK
jgi:hypothetical protein